VDANAGLSDQTKLNEVTQTRIPEMRCFHLLDQSDNRVLRAFMMKKHIA
jgi:hypothetical protein